MSEVILAGYNLDVELIDALRRGEPVPATPETVSAAYARISRDERPVTELRRISRGEVEKARQSNQRIVFEMGHHSIAEHAVFNFDVLGVSRLAIEAIESHRLASFTEKSQRYIRLGTDFVLPREVAAAGHEAAFRAFMQRSFDRYASLLDGLAAHGVDRKLACEDARYVLPLATTGQLGMTVNARTLERMILRMTAHPLREVRDIGEQLLHRTEPIAPSLLLFYQPGPWELRRAGDVADAVAALNASRAPGQPSTVDRQPSTDAVRLVHATPDGDTRILAAVVMPALGGTAEEALEFARGLDADGRERLWHALTRYLGIHDALPRELEHASLTFDVVISAAGFGQLKRHRMSSQTAMPYDAGLGITRPPAVVAAGLAGILDEAAADAERMFADLAGPTPAAAPYALLNAHRRRVLVTMSLRELYHVSRLREDSHSQWDIRHVAGEMSRLGRDAFPLCAGLLGGKDAMVSVLAQKV